MFVQHARLLFKLRFLASGCTLNDGSYLGVSGTSTYGEISIGRRNGPYALE